MSDHPQAPAHLSRRSKALWRRLAAEYDFSAAEQELLRAGLEALDRMDQARGILAADGPVYRDRFGSPRKHPAVAVEEQARIAFARILRELNLEVPADVRPRRIRGRYEGRQ